ncbi:MAG: hypothetical protein LBH19_03555, partial [Dysgonamonadaceae bacterium]|nr:hypothetical protein [Dysgonamonadaceae bacterium]
ILICCRNHGSILMKNIYLINATITISGLRHSGAVHLPYYYYYYYYPDVSHRATDIQSVPDL